MEVISEGKTVRIRINTLEQPRPVVFNYRQLYKKQQKKDEVIPKDLGPPLDVGGDDFYEELLRKAENYAAVDDNDEDDEEEDTINKKSDEYDYEDPFIDDSEMLLDEPYEYSAPEFDGFFVYHGPLDGHEGEDKKSTPVAKRSRAPAKLKASTSTSKRTSTSTTTTDKSRKKTATDEEKKTATPTASVSKTTTLDKKKTPAVASSSSTATSKTIPAVTKPTATTSTVTKSTTVKRTSSTSEHTANKKKKKLDDVKENPISISSSSSTQEDPNDKAKKKTPTIHIVKPLEPEVEILMEKLRRDVKFESFENKAKFPLSLKPTVLEIGLLMFRKHKTIDENLIYHLMQILPYNRFTLKKFLTTKSGQMRVDELQQEIDELAILLKQTIDRMMPEQKRLFNEKVARAQASSETTTEDEEALVPRFKCNDEVRKILYDIIQTEEQSIHIANQVALHKDSEKKSEGLASDNKARKLMYQRLLSCWPEEWMNSYEMSRQYSQYKTKMSSLTEKKAVNNNNIPNTPKANIASVDNKKRKRVTPDTHTKKMADTGSNKSTPELSNSQKPKLPTLSSQVITIDTDDETDEPQKMSYFGNMNQQQQTVNPQNIAMAEQELEMVTDLFNRIVDSCHQKCIKIENSANGELTKEDSLCIDNCVAKFFETNTKVGDKMQKMSQQ